MEPIHFFFELVQLYYVLLEYCCRRDRPSWVKITYTPYFDGHLWRKYGQKKIKDAEYPRYVKITCQVCWYAQFEAQGFGLLYLFIKKFTSIIIPITCMWKWHEGPILVTHRKEKLNSELRSSMHNSYLMMKWSNFHLLLFLLVVGIVFSHYVSFFI